MIKVLNLIFPIYFGISNFFNSTRIGVNKAGMSPSFIVSLTSFPARIDKVWLTIETILHQREKPDRILLWLYNGEFNGMESLPENLTRLEKRGLEIRFCNENMMPHKKYYYTMQNYPDANVITIDDDLFYPPDLLAKLKRFHNVYPKAIISSMVRKIEVTNAIFKSYKEWPYLSCNSLPSYSLLQIGVGGVLYPARSLHQDVFDIDGIKNLALRADDLWLKIMSVKNGTRVVSIAGEYSRISWIPVRHMDKTCLQDSNIYEGQNDKIFDDLVRHYQIQASIFEEK